MNELEKVKQEISDLYKDMDKKGQNRLFYFLSKSFVEDKQLTDLGCELKDYLVRYGYGFKILDDNHLLLTW